MSAVNPATPDPGAGPAVTAGIVAALVGFTSSFAVVLTGLRAVGATDEQAASGLFAMCFVIAFGVLFLALRYRMPITLAWSTPGAALLAGTAAVDGGWPAAVGAFVVVGVAFVVTGAWPRLGSIVSAIPVPLAQAMLAGVVLPLCLEPVTAFAASPIAIAPVLAVWLVLGRVAPRWAVPGAFVAAAVVIAVSLGRGGGSFDTDALIPHVSLVVPQWSWQAMIGIALPLYIVTMASQNVPGSAVMTSFGYSVPWRASMTVTGVGTAITAPAGVHAVNLAAISAALSAAPSAHPNPAKRWIAAATVGGTYVVLGLSSAALAALVVAAPAGVVETVAGLALLATLASAIGSALSVENTRIPAVVTFVVAASGVSVAGIGSAFWALVAGLALYAVERTRKSTDE